MSNSGPEAIAGAAKPPRNHSGQYFPRLDGLRGLAVLAVLIEHFTFSEVVREWNPGMVGVRTFFVLSGFLITSILISERNADSSHWSQAAGFYWRRFVRLSPAMFVAVGILYILDVAQMRESWWVHLLYLSNFQIAHVQYWIPAGHFWSLSVEEQFYLLWFPLVVLAPKRWLVPAIVLFIAGAPLYRLMIPLGMSEYYNVLLPGQVDSLAWGALVAVARMQTPFGWIYRLLRDPRVLWATLATTLFLLNPFIEHGLTSWPLTPAAVSLSGACLVVNCIEARDRTFAWLANPLLMHIGAISYGIYVYHYFVPQVIFTHANDLAVWLGSSMWTKLLRTLIWVGITLLVAEISWRFMERPALRLKTLVYRRRPVTVAPAE
jgi:peptidoglycan/LPS O-acetylase OafA/YrhL